MLLSKRIPRERLETLVAIARTSPASDQSLDYPTWYLHRWHYLPDGYLSRRSTRLYESIVGRLYHAGSEARTLATLTSLLARLRPASVLELASGPGRALEAVAGALPAASVTGVDLSPFMLERARARVGHRAELVHADVCSLPFPANRTFEAVVAIHALGHMPWDAAQDASREAARVLAPGGHLLLLDHRWHPVPDPPGVHLVSHRLTGLGFARLRMFRRAVTAGDAVGRMRQSGTMSSPGAHS